jgi:hypothetical protein
LHSSLSWPSHAPSFIFRSRVPIEDFEGHHYAGAVPCSIASSATVTVISFLVKQLSTL